MGFSDGLAYEGYLWDFLAEKRVVGEAELWRLVSGIPDVYAMWDLHSAERVRIPNYFQLPRGTVIRSDPATLCRGLEYLPEDLYIFDESLTWGYALTHEYLDDRRLCVWSGSRFSDSLGEERTDV